jgi:hypothetical protein
MSVTRLPAPAVLAVLRGVVEANRTDCFFGSQRQLKAWVAKCRQMGLIDQDDRATADGHTLYKRLSLGKLPTGSWVRWHIPYNQFVSPGERVRIPALAGRTGTVLESIEDRLMIDLDPLGNRSPRTIAMLASQLERLDPLVARG